MTVSAEALAPEVSSSRAHILAHTLWLEPAEIHKVIPGTQHCHQSAAQSRKIGGSRTWLAHFANLTFIWLLSHAYAHFHNP